MRNNMAKSATDNIFTAVLQKQFRTQLEASSEIINLKAILDLPKPTEHFLSDLHGEFYAFRHMVKNSSGLIKNKIEQEFSNEISPNEKDNLAICIFYPKELMFKLKMKEINFEAWQIQTIKNLIRVTRVVSRKYTRSKVRKSLPEEYCYIIEELLYETDHGGNKKQYYDSVVSNIVKMGLGESFIIEVSGAIQRLSIDCLHIVGDIFDRGPHPHKIIDELMNYRNVDIQWGNHDVVWIGASCGSEVCIANVIRICARYGHMSVIEEGYGISLRKLYEFAAKAYENDECGSFDVLPDTDHTEMERDTIIKVHKAIALIQFKLEGQLIKRHPEYKMESRLMLDKVLKGKEQIRIGETNYHLNDAGFPTLDEKNPYTLTKEEQSVVDSLQKLFVNNEKLAKHMQYLIKKGNMYLVYNNNLLLHGCIPMDADGGFSSFESDGRKISGKELLDFFEEKMRQAFKDKNKCEANDDIFWYLWSGEFSPLFGKKEMKTFIRKIFFKRPRPSY
jgi:fructose-1,6-bisphosphatase-3